ncbi:MAG: alpha-L-arabinofuranosidase C-terminal domain-containing protein [Candidatus Hydrogenedentales bacterium]|jgi:alpha-N-arabinofuranosidase
MLTIGVLVAAFVQAAASELPYNGTFETPVGKPAGWESQVWGGGGRFTYEQSGRNGSWCVAIGSSDGGDLTWSELVPVQAYSRYRLSAWIKTDNVTPSKGKGALINLHQGPAGKTDPLVGTNDWQQVSFEFDSGKHETIQVCCLFGGWGKATGKAWYDDVSIEYLAPTPIAPVADIDTTKTGAPISKYIYGQFIEHLGRCIYGGIWAEMLEDRKFFYPVGAADSPWTAPRGGVEMIKEGAFVGEHTPRIAAGHSVVQSGLGIVKGKSYEGRIVLAGSGKVTVTLIWGDTPADREQVKVDGISASFAAFPIRFKAGASTDDARIEIVAAETVRLGTISLMPSDNIKGMRRDTLALLRQLDSPIYRWPGGNFVSGYDWRDGIGDRDKRPPRKNPAWTGVEHNDFGIHEFMAFCEELGTDPYIAVNSGLGDIQLAKDEVEYVNGAESSSMGQLRAKNGRTAPWHCVYWSVGNEMYGSWQLGNVPLEQYQQRHNDFAKAMRTADPGIKLVGVGDSGSQWSTGMLTNCADHMDLLSEHFYCNDKLGVVEHVGQLAEFVRKKAESHRKYLKEIPAMQGKFIPIALDEWNYWYGPHAFGELGTRYFVKDGLGVAAGIHEFTRNSDLFFMANYAQTVNVIGCIKTDKTAAAFETTGLALMLYRKHYGETPITVTGNLEALDVAAAWNAGRTALAIGVVNPLDREVTLRLNVAGATIASKGRVWRIAGTDPMGYNDPKTPSNIVIQEERVKEVDQGLSLPKLSINLFEIPASR